MARKLIPAMAPLTNHRFEEPLLLVKVDRHIADGRRRMRRRGHLGRNRHGWNEHGWNLNGSSKNVRRCPRRWRRLAAFQPRLWMMDDLLASRRWRHVADARRFGRSNEFWIQVVAAIGRSLLDFNLNPVCVGVGVLSRPRYLPRDLHVRLVSANAELIAADLRGHNGLRELADHGQLITEIPVEGLEPIRQRDGEIGRAHV